MLYHRDLEKLLAQYARFPAIAILGPWQSGKSTLAKTFFKNHRLLSFEDPMLRQFALSDPRGFLREYENEHGLILDEFQYVPQILSYIQLDIDEKKRPGYFVLTGSQNFLMNQAISQSLAGRIGIVTLLPFSLHELANGGILKNKAIDTMLNGSYPRIYSDNIPPTDLYPSYISTYIERDVRQLLNVGNLATFQKFLSLCAGRIGQLLNLTDIAVNCGISVPTATQWLSVLETSYILFRLQPHFTNFNKRITKTPKLYFYDTGLACSLLQITTSQKLSVSPFRGNIFENMIVSDLIKQYYNMGKRPALYFWSDRNGLVEIDAVADLGTHLVPIEVKSGQTIVSDFFKGLERWNELSDTSAGNNYVIYAGDDNQQRSNGKVVGWQSASTLIPTLYYYQEAPQSPGQRS